MEELHECMICFEKVSSNQFIHHGLCSTLCMAEICLSCLAQHLRIAVFGCIRGLLPKIKCPICLVSMYKSQWSDHMQLCDEYKPIVSQYGLLARLSCGFQVPCCHKHDYTHLPEARKELKDIQMALKELKLDQHYVDQVPQLVDKCQAFLHHKLSPQALHLYVFETFEIKVSQLLLEITLPCFEDEERRASLLLAHLYKYPMLKTRCCDYTVCFNCKNTHEEGVEKCDGLEFNEEEDMVRCRQCHILIVKTAGCDSVVCVCGAVMNWPRELKFQWALKRKLTPSEQFEEFTIFATWQSNLWDMRYNIHHASDNLRRMRFRRVLRKVKKPLRLRVARFVQYIRHRKLHDMLSTAMSWKHEFGEHIISTIPERTIGTSDSFLPSDIKALSRWRILRSLDTHQIKHLILRNHEMQPHLMRRLIT